MNVKRLKLEHSAVHYRALSKFLNQHCQDLQWYHTAMGLVRARNVEGLLQLASSLDESLVNGSFQGSDSRENSSTLPAAGMFKRTSQFVAMVAKYPYDEQQRPGFDPDAKALSTLLKDERRNRRLNSIFRGYRVRGKWRHPAHPIMSDVLHRVLGPDVPLSEVLHRCDFSAGASVGISGQATHIGRKLSSGLATTPSCVPYLYRAIHENVQLTRYVFQEVHGDAGGPFEAPPSEKVDYALFEQWVDRVDYNIVCCVPKNSETSRTIAKEPPGNGFIQKGVDEWMRDQLLRVLNLDLRDQAINQVMAREGSLGCYDPYVTIDIKSASNGVFVELVRSLAPSEWFSFLNAIRSPAGKWPNGEIRRYELFSSMGNGFTFPLETLIFAAAVIAASRMTGSPCDYRIYGDDIICRQSIALLVVEILNSCGFRVNNNKTFIFGPFRESCGANWYEGADVTPVFWRTRITDRLALHAIHNAHVEHPEVQATLRTFDPMLPCVVPDDKAYDWVTDQAFRVTQDTWLTHPSVKWRRDTRSFRYPMLVTSPVKDKYFGVDLRGSSLKHLRWIALTRGATCGDEFLLRKSTTKTYRTPKSDSSLECEVFSGRKVQPHWCADAIHTHKLLCEGGLSQHRAMQQMRDWYPQ